MAVCRNCGKEIAPDEKYCERCEPQKDKFADYPLKAPERANYRPPARGFNRLLMIGMLCMAVLLVAVSIGIALSIPTGPSYTRKAQAAVCRAILRDINRAIDRYYTVNRKYPPKGRIDSAHPLLTDQYLEVPLRCPSTHRYYEIVQDGSRVSAKCDSSLQGHRL